MFDRMLYLNQLEMSVKTNQTHGKIKGQMIDASIKVAIEILRQRINSQTSVWKGRLMRPKAMFLEDSSNKGFTGGI